MPPAAALHRLLTGVAGVIALHQLAYLVAYPGDVGRAVASEGHGYLEPVAGVVVPAVAALAEPAVWVGLGLAPAFALVGRALARTLDRLEVVPSAADVAAPRAPIAPVVPVVPGLRVFALTPAVRRVRGPPPSPR
jgi:hypothetical protein